MTNIKNTLKSESFNQFFHFFTVFTAIFIVMTIIILQIMRFGVYSSVDNSLKTVAKYSNDYAEMTMDRISSYYFDKDNDSIQSAPAIIKDKSFSQPEANTDVILYSANGTVLNSFDSLSKFQHFELDTTNLNRITTRKLINFFGRKEKYHTITVPIQSSNYPAIAYLMAVVTVEQLDRANERYERIVIVVMIIFWLISIIASIYLAIWSRKPILESYENQKMFVENASHELRTPLAVLQNRLESLFRKPNETIMDNYEPIASSLEEVRNMKILTTNLLNLARRDDGITPEFTKVGSEYFDKIFTNFELIAADFEKELTTSNQVNRQLKIDKSLLKQLLTILFDNAIKYTDKDGKIDILVRTTDRNLYISVADNGPGISDIDKKKVFDRFYRVDKARTRSRGGFGLGLSLAKQIVSAMNGSIQIKDNDPKGTLFIVKL